MVATTTLTKIAFGGAIVLATSSYFIKRSITDSMRKSPQYKIGLEALRAHRGAVSMLGEPIREMRVDLGDEENYLDHTRTMLKVPVSGSLKSGVYHFWMEPDQDKWVITRAELGFDDDPSRRLVIVKAFEIDKTKQTPQPKSNVTDVPPELEFLASARS